MFVINVPRYAVHQGPATAVNVPPLFRFVDGTPEGGKYLHLHRYVKAESLILV